MTRRRPARLAALTLTAAAALTLSACGGDDSSSDGKDKIAGADTGDKASASPTPSESTAEGVPEITFPSDAKNVFEGEKTGDAQKDAVLAANTLSVNAVDEAIFEGSTDTKALGFYNADKALSSSITYVQGYIDSNDTWIGVTRYFDRKVTLKGDDKAYVRYCSDESKSYIKNKKSGKVDKSAASADSYVLYNTALTKNAAGVWQTTDIASKRGDKACQP
ncbi:hypothetical protein DMH12_36370 [Streptomyces sp. WAC 04229]|uniref:hypothetical protein n=1 Tax=Streptomyces sp. WAC 04229 TaxID=2203206 RepID=UPI000F74BDE0|nr:hypothetical protein [Streptomyces sp. WAC 04229]RSN39767.1 hypothetical protein DMH12_36370 [Streptomyces sp. WAC 04229]